jgi:NodT family efflux transporter outer membrane factor (OMF) lipoprotein
MRLIWTVFLCLFLSSCQFSMTRKEKVKDQIPAPTLNTSINKSLATPYFQTGNWPKELWWKMFDSKELDGFMHQALLNNPSLEEAKKRIEMARQEAIVVRSVLFPLAELAGNATDLYSSHNGLYRALNSDFPINADLFGLLVNFSYDFDIWGKNRNLFYASIGKVMAQRAETAQVELLITTALADTYFLLKTNLIKKRLYEELLQVRKEIFQLENKMKKNFLYSALEPYYADENVLEAQKLVDAIDDDIDMTKHLLNVLMGKSPDCPLFVNELVDPLIQSIALPPDLSIGLLARRPDLRAQIWRAESSAYLVGASIADYYPDLSITAFLGYQSGHLNNLFSAKSFTYSITPAFNLPIFTAGAITANVCAKKAEYDAIIFAYNQLLLNSAKEVADLLCHARTVFKQKQEQQEIVILAKKRFDLTLLKRVSGLDSKFQTYSLTEEVINKELEDVSLLYKQYFVTIMLIRALGGGFYCL